MSSPATEAINTGPVRLKRFEFRKKKKIEKRRQRRQLNAETNKPVLPPLPTKSEESVAGKQKYERDKALWEEREMKFKAIELAKRAAKEKEEKAKALSQVYSHARGCIKLISNSHYLFYQKRWKDTLLNLPIMPPNFTINTNRKNVTMILGIITHAVN
jgi:hypothetical protein